VAYEQPGALRAALEARLRSHALAAQVDLERLRRRATFERLLVRLEAADPGGWVLKGGMALEVRLADRARSTRDMDLALREVVADGAAVRERLVDTLAGDPDGDGFQFRVGPPHPIRADEAGRPGWRFPVQARLAGRGFASVRLDVVARPDELSATERLTLPGVLAFAGFPAREVEVVDRSQHFAEKLHAYTRDYGDRQSSRVRDLADLVLLVSDGLAPTAGLLATVEHVFATRATHPVPTDLPDPPAFWAGRYATLAAELDLGPRDVSTALAGLREFWAATLSAGGPGSAPPATTT
jgi:Nucleotidyl transferase AbiEii toxin, Type IV TA system